MLATLLMAWCIGSFAVAPLVGRMLRSAQRGYEPVLAGGKALEIA